MKPRPFHGFIILFIMYLYSIAYTDFNTNTFRHVYVSFLHSPSNQYRSLILSCLGALDYHCLDQSEVNVVLSTATPFISSSDVLRYFRSIKNPRRLRYFKISKLHEYLLYSEYSLPCDSHK